MTFRENQFRVTAQEGIPRLIISQLLENGRHGDACAFNDRLAPTNSRMDFNALAHVSNHTRPAGYFANCYTKKGRSYANNSAMRWPWASRVT